MVTGLALLEDGPTRVLPDDSREPRSRLGTAAAANQDSNTLQSWAAHDGFTLVAYLGHSVEDLGLCSARTGGVDGEVVNIVVGCALERGSGNSNVNGSKHDAACLPVTPVGNVAGCHLGLYMSRIAHTRRPTPNAYAHMRTPPPLTN